MSHDARLEQAADVYALGALDGAELAEFEAHLASGCAACAERLRETREALALLPRSLPQVSPPPALRARILDRVAAEQPTARVPVALRPERRGGRVFWWAGWAGLAAAAALLVVVNTQLSATRQEIQALQSRVTTLQAELAEREETVRFLSDPNVRYVSLGGLKPTPEASAWILWNPSTRRGLLLARGLPEAPAGKAYELWALAGAQPVPAGVFTVDAAGRALLRLPVLPPDHTFDAFAVTLEPAGGVPTPTGPMHLHGKVL
jgi:anti-sigma-K factor RskA